MIGFLKGKILSLSPETALIETASGVGFEVLLSGEAYNSLAGKKEGEVFTYMQVREDGVSLFGFCSPEEKEMFLVQSGEDLNYILSETYGFEFYITDKQYSYLLCFNHHNILYGCGVAEEWINTIRGNIDSE